MPYEIQENIEDLWTSNWRYDEGDGEKLELFETPEEAVRAIDEYVHELLEAWDPAYCDDAESIYHRFRIRYVDEAVSEAARTEVAHV